MSTTISFPSVSLTGAFVDLAVASPAIASVDVFYQNMGSNPLYLYFGGTTAPAATDGIVLKPGDSFQGNAAHVWARGDGSSKLAFVAI